MAKKTDYSQIIAKKDTQMDQEIKTVVVLGMHRSGTSLLAGVLHKLGVSMEQEKPKPYWSNPFGHFEDRRFIKLNDSILQAAGGSWDCPPERDCILSQNTNFKNEIETLIKKSASSIWGWKDPRTCLTIDLFMPYLINPYFIVCRRNPDMVAKSLNRRDNTDIEVNKKIAAAYQNCIDEFIKRNASLPRIEIEYEKFTSDPESTLNAIVGFLGLDTTEKEYNNAKSIVLPNEKIRKMSNRMWFFRQLKLRKKKFTKALKSICS